jgi:hypothetical protein
MVFGLMIAGAAPGALDPLLPLPFDGAGFEAGAGRGAGFDGAGLAVGAGSRAGAVSRTGAAGLGTERLPFGTEPGFAAAGTGVGEPRISSGGR